MQLKQYAQATEYLSVPQVDPQSAAVRTGLNSEPLCRHDGSRDLAAAFRHGNRQLGGHFAGDGVPTKRMGPSLAIDSLRKQPNIPLPITCAVPCI